MNHRTYPRSHNDCYALVLRLGFHHLAVWRLALVISGSSRRSGFVSRRRGDVVADHIVVLSFVSGMINPQLFESSSIPAAVDSSFFVNKIARFRKQIVA